MALWQTIKTGALVDDNGTAAPGEDGFVPKSLKDYNYLGRSPAAETPQAKDAREQREKDEAAAAEQQRLADEARTANEDVDDAK